MAERKMEVRTKLRKARLKKGLTMWQLAQKAYIAPVTLRKIETLGQICGKYTRKELARVLKLPVTELFDENGFAKGVDED